MYSAMHMRSFCDNITVEEFTEKNLSKRIENRARDGHSFLRVDPISIPDKLLRGVHSYLLNLGYQVIIVKSMSKNGCYDMTIKW